jgi:hypothetical protein
VSVSGPTDEERLGRDGVFVCPCCWSFAQRAYELEGREVCGFCRGIGPDGMLTGRHGLHPPTGDSPLAIEERLR